MIDLTDISDSRLVTELRNRGWTCSRSSGPWSNLCAISRQAGFYKNWLWKVLAQGTTPPGLEIMRNSRGRAINARAGTAFYEWAAGRK